MIATFFYLLCALATGLWIYSQLFQLWYFWQTKGGAYFKKPRVQRQAFIHTLQKHARLLTPFYRFMAKGISHKKLASIGFQGYEFPAATCTPRSLMQAQQYQANAADIFIVTFMKSGTSWLQNIVFEILHHGEGSFAESPYQHLYAISPWLESSGIGSVSMEEAPTLSRYQKRIIKTHLSAALCPQAESAKYLYLERKPVDTFISCAHFFNKMAGPFCPDLATLTDLFCSHNMFWGAWPNHTKEWQNRALMNNNVLYLHYDELLNHPQKSIQHISEFLGIHLSSAEIEKIATKTHFSAMQKNEAYFEMAAPNIFSVNSTFRFFNAANQQELTLNTTLQERIKTFCYPPS